MSVETLTAQKFKEQSEFRLWLQSELTQRCKKNPKYSLRAFAAFLEVDPSTLSQILSGKRKTSPPLLKRFCEILGADPAAKKRWTTPQPTVAKEPFDFELLQADAFTVLADWYHFAILELIEVENFQSKTGWIARSLGITHSEAATALERMSRLNLIKKENDQWVRTATQFTNFTPGSVQSTSAAHKSLQLQLLQLAIDAIQNTPQAEKDITSMTMAIDIEKLPEARHRITQFRRDMSAFLEEGKQTRVYNLAIQLYPLSKNLKGNL